MAATSYIFELVKSNDVEKLTELLRKKVYKVNQQDGQGRAALHVAAEEGHVDVVQLLLKYKADVNITNKQTKTALHVACRKGHLKVTKVIIAQRGARLNVMDDDGRTPLLFVAMYGRCDIAKLLIDAGCDVNIQDQHKGSALFYAVEGGHESLVNLLIKAKCDVTSQNKSSQSVLHRACLIGYTSIVKELIKAGCSVTIKDKDGRTAFLEAVRNGHTDIVKYILDLRASARLRRLFSMEALVWAAKAFHLKVANTLIKEGFDANVRDCAGMTALHYASKYGLVEIGRMLIDRGSAVNMQDNDKKTALHYASDFRQTDAMKLLVESGSDVNIQDNCKKTALHYASMFGRTEEIQLLIKSGCDVNIQDDDKKTALHYASMFGRSKEIQLLIKNGCDVNIQDDDKKTALHYASKMLCVDRKTIKLLIENGCAVCLRDSLGKTALHYASEYGHTAAEAVLIEGHCDVDIRDNESHTALLYAMRNDHVNVVSLFLDAGGDVGASNEHRLVAVDRTTDNLGKKSNQYGIKKETEGIDLGSSSSLEDAQIPDETGGSYQMRKFLGNKVVDSKNEGRWTNLMADYPSSASVSSRGSSASSCANLFGRKHTSSWLAEISHHKKLSKVERKRSNSSPSPKARRSVSHSGEHSEKIDRIDSTTQDHECIVPSANIDQAVNLPQPHMSSTTHDGAQATIMRQQAVKKKKPKKTQFQDRVRGRERLSKRHDRERTTIRRQQSSTTHDRARTTIRRQQSSTTHDQASVSLSSQMWSAMPDQTQVSEGFKTAQKMMEDAQIREEAESFHQMRKFLRSEVVPEKDRDSWKNVAAGYTRSDLASSSHTNLIWRRSTSLPDMTQTDMGRNKEEFKRTNSFSSAKQRRFASHNGEYLEIIDSIDAIPLPSDDIAHSIMHHQTQESIHRKKSSKAHHESEAEIPRHVSSSLSIQTHALSQMLTMNQAANSCSATPLDVDDGERLLSVTNNEVNSLPTLRALYGDIVTKTNNGEIVMPDAVEAIHLHEESCTICVYVERTNMQAGLEFVDRYLSDTERKTIIAVKGFQFFTGCENCNYASCPSLLPNTQASYRPLPWIGVGSPLLTLCKHQWNRLKSRPWLGLKQLKTCLNLEDVPFACATIGFPLIDGEKKALCTCLHGVAHREFQTPVFLSEVRTQDDRTEVVELGTQFETVFDHCDWRQIRLSLRKYLDQDLLKIHVDTSCVDPSLIKCKLRSSCDRTVYHECKLALPSRDFKASPSKPTGVTKLGIVTGHTHGSIYAWERFHRNPGAGRRLQDSLAVTPLSFAKAGDSGSLVTELSAKAGQRCAFGLVSGALEIDVEDQSDAQFPSVIVCSKFTEQKAGRFLSMSCPPNGITPM